MDDYQKEYFQLLRENKFYKELALQSKDNLWFGILATFVASCLNFKYYVDSIIVLFFYSVLSTCITIFLVGAAKAFLTMEFHGKGKNVPMYIYPILALIALFAIYYFMN